MKDKVLILEDDTTTCLYYVPLSQIAYMTTDDEVMKGRVILKNPQAVQTDSGIEQDVIQISGIDLDMTLKDWMDYIKGE